MLTETISASLVGISANEVTVEVDASRGLPGEQIVGLPDTVIRESKSRIKAAIKNSGFEYPIRFITINLAPADLPKEGPSFDLPIAVGILKSTDQIKLDPKTLIIGELSLDGKVKPIKGLISICQLALSSNISSMIIPADNLPEAQLIPGLTLYPISHIKDLLELDEKKVVVSEPKFNTNSANQTPLDISEIKGQWTGKRALEVAAAGRHNVLLIGPPGSGKTMLLKRIPSILPDLSLSQAIDSYQIQSVAKRLSHQDSFTRIPPFRSPHHSISYAGMVGGGKTPKPGEISLAHHGILFCDEFPEFHRQVIEVLRQPLEEKQITISRANFSVDYPANFMFVAAMNPCPCGYYQDTLKACTCTDRMVQNYWKKISGPILDRFDIILDIPRLNKEDFYDDTAPVLYSKDVKNKVIQARQKQKERFNTTITNSELTAKQLKHITPRCSDIQKVLSMAIEKGDLTGRSYDRVLKVAQTLADLDNQDKIELSHILEALQFRRKLT